MSIAAVAAHTDTGEDEATDHRLRAVHTGADRGAVTEFTPRIDTPAVSRAARGNGAGVVVASADPGKREAADDGLWAILV